MHFHVPSLSPECQGLHRVGATALLATSRASLSPLWFSFLTVSLRRVCVTKTDPIQVCNSVVYSNVTELCSHHHSIRVLVDFLTPVISLIETVLFDRF